MPSLGKPVPVLVLCEVMGAALNARLRTAGRAWVEQHYAWQTVYRRVDAVYARLLDHTWRKARGEEKQRKLADLQGLWR